jgi:acyl-CoA synthetase (AMP-forming)/AMP-acid ligase II/thioesterase domain-containing protein
MDHQTVVNGEFQRHSGPQPGSFHQVTIGAKIREHAETQPDHPAVVSSTFAPLSYRELQSRIDAVRAALRRAGLGRTARVAVAMPNGPQAALAIVAVSCAAVCIPLNPRQTLPEIEKCLGAVRPEAIVLMKDEESAARQAAAAAGLTIIEAVPVTAGGLGFDVAAPRAAAAASDEPDEPDPEAPAFVLQTSGTTADSKLIPTSHRNMLAAAARVQVWFNLTPQDRCLSASPVFYAHGLHVTVFAVLLSGGTIAFPADASKLDFAEWFGALKPTWYSAGPTLHRLVLDQVKSGLGTGTKHALRFIVSGGAPLPPDVQEELRQALDIPVLEHYGSSEGMQICANQLPPGRSKPGTCGAPWPDTIKIVGDDGRELPPGELGEILIGGPTVVSGYLNAPDLTCSCFLNGWFKSGDVGSIDRDGFLTLHGRRDDLINRGGEKISPLEIDEALARHPAVAEAAAFAIPHARLGQDVAAAVVLRPGMTASPLELRSHLRNRVAAFKVPRKIVIRDQLPKGVTGKVLRRLVAESLLDAPSAGNPIVASQTLEDESVDNQLVMQLTTLWERLLKTPISPDDDFFEKGGDSLLAMDMLCELDLLTGESVSSSVLLDASTVRELARKLSERRNLKVNYLVPIHPTGRKQPLIFFHGDFIGGGGFITAPLAKLLGADQPLLVAVPHGTDDEAIPHSIEAMAAERLPLIMKAQPEGPYRICGNCLGGIVAFEVARLLVAAGQEVEMVCMIDPPTVNSIRSVQMLLSIMRCVRPFLGPVVDRATARTWYRFTEVQKFWNLSWSRRWNAINNRVRGRDHHAAIAATADRSKWKPASSPFGQFADALTTRYAAAMSNYNPKPLDVRVIYIAVDHGPGKWKRVSPNLTVVKMAGTHYTPNVPRIAELLNAYLAPDHQ